jgi:hypothetical protein
MAYLMVEGELSLVQRLTGGRGGRKPTESRRSKSEKGNKYAYNTSFGQSRELAPLAKAGHWFLVGGLNRSVK